MAPHTATQSTQSTTTRQLQPSTWLVGRSNYRDRNLVCCPWAQTLTGYSLTLDRYVILALNCKRWACEVCGRERMRYLAWRVERAQPNRLITLTVQPALYDDPRQAYDETRRKIPDLTKKIRKSINKFEYMKVLEATKKGWPHYHFVARCPYIPQRTLSDWWAESTGAPIVDVRMIRKHQKVYNYVCKYLAKQDHVPWTNRRISWSRHFFPPLEKPKQEGLNLTDIEVHHYHPANYLRDYHTNDMCHTIFEGAVWIEPRGYSTIPLAPKAKPC